MTAFRNIDRAGPISPLCIAPRGLPILAPVRPSLPNLMKPLLLVLNPLSTGSLDLIRGDMEVLYAPDAASRAAAVGDEGARIRAVLTIGTIGLSAAEIDAMPKLELICAQGVGYENIAIGHARQRGIALANGAGTNADSVADHAFALLLATLRQIPKMDRACRDGIWRDALPVPPQAARKKLGLIGFGAIGRKIAQRGLGFDMAIGYHTRSKRDDVAHPWFDSVPGLAEWCDLLVVATPGGPATQHLVNAAVLDALGPQGYLVNISRGSTVDTRALAAALSAGRIAGAGLDVYESEPAPPAELIGLKNVVLTPHIGGASPEAHGDSLRNFIENARRHFAGEPLLTPI